MHKCVVSAAFIATLLTGMSFAQAPKGEKSLYERLGGQPAIEAVANGLVDRILQDTGTGPGALALMERIL